ncbi:MAG: hypothetical protein HXS44_08825 [Theionarchaea archaeon]|nr:hypothetical protein [Theionarchaea archaeon]
MKKVSMWLADMKYRCYDVPVQLRSCTKALAASNCYHQNSSDHPGINKS